MNGRLISIENFDPAGLVLKPPNGSLSEIWYLDKSGPKPVAVRPVFKTPRLPVKYGAKRFSDQSSYGYCLNLSNKDIDPEIGEFYTFIKTVDRALINAFTEKHKSWATQPTKCLKYRTAMKRRSPQDDFYFQLKMVHSEKGAEIATVIYNNQRKQIGPEEITYGKYTDQFICPTYLHYDDNGMRPIWQAQQIVVSAIEKVFLEHCILDHLDGGKIDLLPMPPPPPPQMPYFQVNATVPARIEPAMTPRLDIKPGDLQQALQKLKKAPLKEETSSDEDL